MRKSFGGVHALKAVDLVIEAGRVYHLMGENGCGKSTLIKIISARRPPTRARSSWMAHRPASGRATSARSARCAPGSRPVYQDLSLLPNLSVAENVALPGSSSPPMAISPAGSTWGRSARDGGAALAKVQLPTDRDTSCPGAPTRCRSPPANSSPSRGRWPPTRGSSSWDEPTTSLTRQEVDNLLRVVERLRAGGVAVLFVTHKLEECKAIGGRAIIMRDGRKVAELDVAEHSKAEFMHWMTGREISEARYRTEPKLGDTLLEVEAWGRRLPRRVLLAPARRDPGLHGLADSGRNELALALAGVRPARSGHIRLARGRWSCARRGGHRGGIGYVPEETG